ncbi:hypothetical protein [Candidatus Methanomassiliicoccus intestinalis]|uniref:hypothetical protein n=1 Tax=Candidatus Methanomassiliicoccus intestinalis TaxID=1406512 RepID=UPI0037DC0371
MGDFERKYGSFRAGFSYAASYALSVIIIPIVLAFSLSYIIDHYGILTEFSNYAKDFWTIIIIGGVLTALAFFYGYYPKGSCSRAAAGALLAGSLFLFLWQISAIITVMFDLTNVFVDVDFSFFIFLIGLFCGMKFIYVLGELLFYRRRWKKERNLIDSSLHTESEL